MILINNLEEWYWLLIFTSYHTRDSSLQAHVFVFYSIGIVRTKHVRLAGAVRIENAFVHSRPQASEEGFNP
jgi:hypothetical protein